MLLHRSKTSKHKMQISVILTGFLLVNILTGCQAVCENGCRACTERRYHCPGASLTHFPTNMPTDTQTLDLTQNNINSLDRMPSLPDVQSFRMSLNKLQVIPGGIFDDMPAIMSLDLSSNSISKVYKHGLRGLDSLKSISLNGNNIKELGMIFWNTKAVNTIRLGNNQIESIKEENFVKNDMIKMLDLSHNQISSIDSNSFKNLNMLRYLILSNNPLKHLNDLTFSSTMLTLADFSNCQLESVPRTMPPSLMDLRLGNNLITKTEVDDFENITSLTLLTLNDNKISQVEHRSFHNLHKLKELWLSRNDLVYIPRGLPQGLLKLFIDNNVVVELEQRLFPENSSLKVLTLEGNKVSRVHQDSLKDVRDLEKLNLQGNQISLIDGQTFSDLPNLQMLTLTENPIEMFERGAFRGLGSLSEIHMAYIGHSNANKDRILQENFLLYMQNLTTINLMSSGVLGEAFVEMFDKTNGQTLDKVEQINLQFCGLTSMGPGMKRLFPNIRLLLLDENLFHCDTRLLWLYEWMKTTSDTVFFQYEEPKCNTPIELKGRAITDLNTNEFVEASAPQGDTYNYQQPDRNEAEQRQSSTNTAEVQTSESSRDIQSPASNERQQPPSGSSRRPTVSDLSGGRHSPSSGGNSMGGVRVVIKPPKDSQRSKEDKKQNNGKMTKAERKAARKAARERKRQERIENRRRQRAANDDARRKKRRIRNEKSKNCTTDKDGNRKCRRRNRCKVQSDGTTKCRKRKGKGKKQKKRDSQSS